jgi:hypothetical protein
MFLKVDQYQPHENFSRLPFNLKLLIGSKQSLGYQEIKFSLEERNLISF